MFIDIHAHAYLKPNGFPHRFHSTEELLAVWDKYDIEKGCVLPIVNPEIYSPQSNEDVLDMAEKYPDRIIPFCNIDPRAITNSPDAPLDKMMQYYKDRGCKGIGEVMPNLEVMDPLVQNLFRCAEKVGLSVTYDGSDQKFGDFGLYDDPGLPQLEHTLQRFPELKILGHGPVFWAEIAKLETPGERGFVFAFNGTTDQCGLTNSGRIVDEGVVPKLFRRYPNLMGDLSDGTAYNAFARDEEYGPKFMNEFQDRLFFGTDLCNYEVGNLIPLELPGLMIRWKEEGKISETVFRKIARENAIKFFGLE